MIKDFGTYFAPTSKNCNSDSKYFVLYTIKNGDFAPSSRTAFGYVNFCYHFITTKSMSNGENSILVRTN